MLANANASMQKEMDAEARAKLEAARAANNGGSSGGVLQATGKLASENTAAKGKLATPSGTPAPTPPPSGGLSGGALKPPTAATGGSRLILRKPATTSASSKLFKKSSSVSSSSKLRVNKISSNEGEDAFEDVETTQKAIADEKKKAEDEVKRQQEEDAKLAQKLQDEMNGLGIGSNSSNGDLSTTVPATPTSTPASGIIAPSDPPKPKMSAMEEGIAKLSAMNNDFFSGM